MSNTSKSDTQALKDKLKVLKKHGLYSGDLRKQPTRYAKSLIKKFDDVISGNAQVVKVPKTKGEKQARAKARELADAFGDTVRAKGSHVIVKVKDKGEKARYVGGKQGGTIATTRTLESGTVLTHEYIRGGMEHLPPLRPGESYALPLKNGRSIMYIYRAKEEEIYALANHYEHDPKKPYVGASQNIQIVYQGKRRKRR
jgi:hypothetical protein